MKIVILISFLITLAACSTRQINNKQQTFTDYVILNKKSNYEGKSIEDWSLRIIFQV